MLKPFLGLIILSFVFHKVSIAQNPDIRRYINNIVDIDGGNFGFIVGSKGDDNLYFITATSNEEESPSSLNVRFYRTAQKGSAILIKKFAVKNSQFYLYTVKVTSAIKWEAYSYSSLFETQGPYYSYLDNGKSDSVWYINSSKLALNEKISNELAQLKVGRDDVYHKGMPVIDGSNRIVGIIAQSQGTSEVTFLTIDMQTVAKKLDEFSKCNYFKLIAFGQSATPCEIQKKIVEQDIKEKNLAKENNQIYGVAFGPAFSVNYNMASGTGESGISAFGYSIGANIYFRPDNGRFKVTVKPRYTYSPLGVPKEFPFDNSVGYRAKSYRIRELEMPIMLEWITRRRSEGAAGFISIGYIPGYQLPYVYRYTTTAHSSITRASHDGVSGMIHKLGIELGIQGPVTRVSFIASYQLTPWFDPDYYTQIDSRLIYPTTGVGFSYLLIGIDIGIRLKGEWGLKTK